MLRIKDGGRLLITGLWKDTITLAEAFQDILLLPHILQHQIVLTSYGIDRFGLEELEAGRMVTKPSLEDYHTSNPIIHLFCKEESYIANMIPLQLAT